MQSEEVSIKWYTLKCRNTDRWDNKMIEMSKNLKI